MNAFDRYLAFWRRYALVHRAGVQLELATEYRGRPQERTFRDEYDRLMALAESIHVPGLGGEQVVNSNSGSKNP